MTQEEKELLLKDLCARLPYGVHVEISWKYSKTYVHTGLEYYEFPNIDSLLNMFWDEKCISIKPYLRSLSSITEEEKRHISKIMCLRTYDNGVVYDMTYPVYTPYYVMEDCLSYLRSIHVDYSGLIEKGLALEAPEGMYKID